MARKHKNIGKTTKKGAKKALRTVQRHGVLSAALAAMGGIASSVLASDKFRKAIQDLLSNLIARASKELDSVASTSSKAISRVSNSGNDPSGDDEHAGRDDEHGQPAHA